jgi:hypothetical protein
MSDDQNGDKHQQELGPDLDGKAGIDPPNEPRRAFQPVVIKGGLTSPSEVSAEDHLWERLIRLGVRPGGPTFPEVMRQRLREQFPDLTEEDLDDIAKYYF